MTSDVLTFDNLLLSSLNFESGAPRLGPDGQNCEINCTNAPDRLGSLIGMSPGHSTGPLPRSDCEINCTNLLDRVAEFVRQSRSPNTNLAYTSDLAAFQAWGGTLPATPLVVAAFLAGHADTHSVATLKRRLAAISSAHKAHQLPNPVTADLVRATLRGIARTRGRPAEAATPLLRDDLLAVLDRLGNASAKDCRDRALLLIGFAGGFRRSELVGLDVTDLAFVPQGVIVTVRRSKTDQQGAGQQIAIPHGRMTHCPVGALERWLRMSAIDAGALFRPINRHGAISGKRLSPGAVSKIIKERVAAAGIDPTKFSGHSLRSGFATSAAMAGTPLWKIRMQTRHATNEGVARYVRPGRLFEQNAATDLF